MFHYVFLGRLHNPLIENILAHLSLSVIQVHLSAFKFTYSNLEIWKLLI